MISFSSQTIATIATAAAASRVLRPIRAILSPAEVPAVEEVREGEAIAMIRWSGDYDDPRKQQQQHTELSDQKRQFL